MDVYVHLAKMASRVAESDWDGLEAAYEQVCRKLAGRDRAQTIGCIRLDPYQSDLRASLTKAAMRATRFKSKAIYFEYDMDNNWEGAFFLCPTYAKAGETDEWAAQFDHDSPGPRCRKLAAQYDSAFDTTPSAQGTTLYLVARTVAAFGRASAQVSLPAVALCIGFHDQDPIMRIRDAGDHAGTHRRHSR